MVSLFLLKDNLCQRDGRQIFTAVIIDDLNLLTAAD